MHTEQEISDVVIKDSMNKLVSDPNLRDLQKLIGRFNTFRVLGIENMEIRHSRILAWLLTPSESHGLGDHFLRRYLMSLSSELENGLPEAVVLGITPFNSVEISREWKNIDLMIDISTSDEKWLFIYENKVHSQQHSNQLCRYRTTTEEYYPDHDRFYFLLSKFGETPKDSAYNSTTYDNIHQSLESVFEEFESSLGDGPKVLIKNYLTLLEEKFMEKSEIQELAQKLYKAYRPAMDTIIEHRPEIEDDLCEYLKQKVDESETLKLMHSNSRFFRFIPIEWDHQKNLAGRAWGNPSPYVLFEINLKDKHPILKIVVGKAPLEWVKKVYARSSSPPFKEKSKKLGKNTKYVTIDSFKSSLKILNGDGELTDNIEEQTWKWIQKTMNAREVQERIKVVQELIETIPIESV